MSLDNFEEQNVPSIVPLSGFSDSESFGRRSDGMIVHIADTSTWAGVFKNGLSLDYDYGSKYLVKPVESVIQQSEPINIPQKKIMTSPSVYDDYYYYKENTKVPRTLKYTPPDSFKLKKVEKTRRAKKKKIEKPSKYNTAFETPEAYAETFHNHLVCKCKRCADIREWKMCDCCGEMNLPLRIYQHCVHKNQESKMCDTCAQFETCPGCGMDSGGELCRFCRSCSW